MEKDIALIQQTEERWMNGSFFLFFLAQFLFQPRLITIFCVAHKQGLIFQQN